MKLIFTFFLFVVVARGNGAMTNHMALEDLRRMRLPEVALDSVTQAADYVDVQGVIGSHIRFELLLPDAWNGRFVMGGGGGFVGTVQNGAQDSVHHGYATVGTDTGHETLPGLITASWALDNLEARVDFGYLAVHRTAVVAKSIIRNYYGSDATYSYFVGCSRGGGQAMMEAQRYPEDFNGIVAGAPAFDWTGIAANVLAIQKVLYPDPQRLDQTALDRSAMKKLQAAIIEQCDAQDGLKDGVVQDPPSAHFDLSKVAGLTDAQRQAITAIYGGAHNDGREIYPGYSPGAECDPNQWTAWIVGPAPSLAPIHAPDLMFAFGTQIFKYLIFNDPDWNYTTYNMTNFTRDTRLAASYLNATNVDLSGLEKHNGKLIIWHGWADPALPAQATVNYYRQLQSHDPRAADYCRLFMVPGCFHCGGGPGATEVNWLPVIVDWVEHGSAPDRVIASKTVNSKVAMTRPLYCYPTTAIYKGSGDPASAENFVPKEAQAIAH